MNETRTLFWRHRLGFRPVMSDYIGVFQLADISQITLPDCAAGVYTAIIHCSPLLRLPLFGFFPGVGGDTGPVRPFLQGKRRLTAPGTARVFLPGTEYPHGSWEPTDPHSQSWADFTIAING